MNSEILEFLMEHDVILLCRDTHNEMTADEAFELGGEFVVYDDSPMSKDLYRGLDFEKAVRILEGLEEVVDD